MDKEKILRYAARCTYASNGWIVTHNSKVIYGETLAETVSKMLTDDAQEEIELKLEQKNDN